MVAFEFWSCFVLPQHLLKDERVISLIKSSDSEKEPMDQEKVSEQIHDIIVSAVLRNTHTCECTHVQNEVVVCVCKVRTNIVIQYDSIACITVVLPSCTYQLTSGVRTFKIIINKGGTTQYGDVRMWADMYLVRR